MRRECAGEISIVEGTLSSSVSKLAHILPLGHPLGLHGPCRRSGVVHRRSREIRVASRDRDSNSISRSPMNFCQSWQVFSFLFFFFRLLLLLHPLSSSSSPSFVFFFSSSFVFFARTCSNGNSEKTFLHRDLQKGKTPKIPKLICCTFGNSSIIMSHRMLEKNLQFVEHLVEESCRAWS